MKLSSLILFLVLAVLLTNLALYATVSTTWTVLYLGFFYALPDVAVYNVQYLASIGCAFLLTLLINYKALFNKKGAYGDAKFATLSDLKGFNNNLLDSEGLLLGKKQGRYLRNNDPLSVLIPAPQGTGKTAAVIIPSLFSYTGSALINDVKGELWNKTSKQRATFSKVALFAPTLGLDHEATVSFNPLHEKCIPDSWENTVEHVNKMATVIYPVLTADKGSAHFVAEAKTLFLFFALALVEKRGGTSIPEIFDTVYEADDVQEVIRELMDSGLNDYTEKLGNALLQKEGAEFSSVKSTFRQAMDAFVTPLMRKSLMECDFTYKTFREEAYSLYLYLPPADIEKIAPILRVLIEYLVNEFLSHEWHKEHEPQVTFFMDEFPRLGKMESIKNMPTLSRSFGVRAMFVFQNAGQMQQLYGDNVFAEFISNTDFKTIFSQNEDKTAERFSKLVGNTTRSKKSKSRNSQLLKDGGSNSESEEGVPLILPQDLMNLKKDELIILSKSNHERPIKCEPLYWFKEKSMLPLVGEAYNLNLDEYTL